MFDRGPFTGAVIDVAVFEILMTAVVQPEFVVDRQPEGPAGAAQRVVTVENQPGNQLRLPRVRPGGFGDRSRLWRKSAAAPAFRRRPQPEIASEDGNPPRRFQTEQRPFGENGAGNHARRERTPARSNFRKADGSATSEDGYPRSRQGRPIGSSGQEIAG